MTTISEATSDTTAELTPALVCRALLQAMEGAEGQTRRRKRDQAPDRLGLASKRAILEQVVEDAPSSEAFEAWLLEQIERSETPGATRAMCEEVFLEYQTALHEPAMAHWLRHGAPTDDAEQGRTRRRDRGGAGDGSAPSDRWRGTDDMEFACTCHLPQR
jgi:hypothetical protein